MGQHVHHDQGIAVGVPGLLDPFPVHRSSQFLTRHHLSHPATQGALQLLMRNPGQGAGDDGGVGGCSRTKPNGSFSAGQCILAKRAMWAMVV